MLFARSLPAQVASDRLPDVVPSAPHAESEPTAAEQYGSLAWDDGRLAAPQAAVGTLSVSSELLLWNVREGSADNWAQQITPKVGGSGAGTAGLVDAPFDWNAGFRVGLAYSQGEDDFDAGISYTHFQTDAMNQASGEVYSAFLANFYVGNPDGNDFGPHYRNAMMQWDFAFHTMDFEVGRRYTISPTLALRPFVGVKAAVIQQSMNSTWIGPIDTTAQTYLFTSAVENLKQDFWGIGPNRDGQNMLGKLWMEVRAELNAAQLSATGDKDRV